MNKLYYELARDVVNEIRPTVWNGADSKSLLKFSNLITTYTYGNYKTNYRVNDLRKILLYRVNDLHKIHGTQSFFLTVIFQRTQDLFFSVVTIVNVSLDVLIRVLHNRSMARINASWLQGLDQLQRFHIMEEIFKNL